VKTVSHVAKQAREYLDTAVVRALWLGLSDFGRTFGTAFKAEFKALRRRQ
jgi:hypothetical protein